MAIERKKLVKMIPPGLSCCTMLRAAWAHLPRDRAALNDQPAMTHHPLTFVERGRERPVRCAAWMARGK